MIIYILKIIHYYVIIEYIRINSYICLIKPIENEVITSFSMIKPYRIYK